MWSDLALEPVEHVGLGLRVEGDVLSGIQVFACARSPDSGNQQVYGILDATKDPAVRSILLNETREIRPGCDALTNVDPTGDRVCHGLYVRVL